MVRGQFGGRERQAASWGSEEGLQATSSTSESATFVPRARSIRPSYSSSPTAATSRGPRRAIHGGAIRALLGLLLAALPLLGACTTTGGSPRRPGRSAYEPYAPSPSSRSTSSTTTRTRGAPAWRFRPLSWAKLADVETWLAAEGARADARTRIEAELVLAEGRLVFAQRPAPEADAVAPLSADRPDRGGAVEDLLQIDLRIDPPPAGLLAHTVQEEVGVEHDERSEVGRERDHGHGGIVAPQPFKM